MKELQMIKITSSVTYPSTTVPGRMQSSYLSTPVQDPTPDEVLRAIMKHIDALQHHMNICDISTMVFVLSVE